jgi:uncharacterized membrane protein YobD (UPF0266 family)
MYLILLLLLSYVVLAIMSLFELFVNSNYIKFEVKFFFVSISLVEFLAVNNLNLTNRTKLFINFKQIKLELENSS